MVEEFGMSDFGIRFAPPHSNQYANNQDISDKKKTDQDNAIDNILNSCFDSALKVITKHRKLLHLIAESLLILETITMQDIEFIHKNNDLPQSAKDKKKANPDTIYFDLNIIKKKSQLQ